MKPFLLCITVLIISLSAEITEGQVQTIFTIPGNNVPYSLLATDDMLYLGTGGSGLFNSPDTGNTWTAINNGIPGSYYFSLFNDNDTVYTGSFGVVYMTYNNGGSWWDLHLGLDPNNNVNTILKIDEDKARLLLTSGNLMLGCI